jgi:hypothetical protein
VNARSLSTVLLLIGGSLSATGSTQSLSRIGNYLNWVEPPVPMPMGITNDGEAIVFVESRGDGCTGNT